jgi:hypothetical protein
LNLKEKTKKKLSKKPPFKGGVGGSRWPQLNQKKTKQQQTFQFFPQ